MPRNTAKCKTQNGSNVKYYDSSKNKRKPSDVRKEKSTKKELGVNTPNEAVVHRKSARRRIARDIFLVFEEQSNSRRNSRANRKQAKPKFGHLKVDDPIRPKGLLRDTRNEPKCYIYGSCLNSSGVLSSDNALLKCKSNKVCVKKEGRSAKSKKAKCETVSSVYSNKSKNVKPTKFSTLVSQPSTLENEPKLVARVNPIFVWVKQDDTRIVEVRCEDYDKRNRIRITKTSNGWRAIPRSDPTSSRVLKFYPTPLMKVKREKIHDINIIHNKIEKNTVCNDFATSKILAENIAQDIDIKLNGIDTVYNPLSFNIKSKAKDKNTKPRKSFTKKSTRKSTSGSTAECNAIVNIETSAAQLNKNFNEISLEVSHANITLESKLNNGLCAKDLYENMIVHTLERNDENIETNTKLINSTLKTDISRDMNCTYQKESEKDTSYLLCPKTGIFLPNNISVSLYGNESIENMEEKIVSRSKNYFPSSKGDLNIGIDDEDPKIHTLEENVESLEAKTKNLKDLLDDADLLQNCDDNANIDADLIDTLVKTSCENNLIPENDIITKPNKDHLNQKTLHEAHEMVVPRLTDVSDQPKCLSFNEAGEIEGVNGDLFQSNTFMETFDKQATGFLSETEVVLHSTTSLAESSAHLQKSSSPEGIEPIARIMDNNSKLHSVSEIEDSPKDLSYKKREEVCPPSESRSQCAVTSSSDVIKSPQQEETPLLASSSETLKNLILEHFVKLKALATPHQIETIDIEQHIDSDVSNLKTIYTSKTPQPSDFIETVVIRDEENGSDIESEEPIKKRLRLNKHKVKIQNVGKLSIIDKDPDPLTQLRLLIRNTQWKVPDPILVPKDRLNAVLASPAREIPLLITTRPELRLPEAFAYPEIIQNPNILVISMAQLEAILKNELEAEKATTFKAIDTESNQQLSDQHINVQSTSQLDNLETQSPILHQHTSKQPKNILTSTNTSQIKNNIPLARSDISASSNNRQQYGKCSQNNSTLTSSNLNSTTLAVLNQLLWLPYFGQIGKQAKNPTSIQDKCEKLGPVFDSQLSSATNFEENINKASGHSALNSELQNFKQQFETNEELSLFQKIVQNQMHSVLQLHQLNKVESSQFMTSVASGNVSPMDTTNSKIESLPTLLEQRRPKVVFSHNNKQTNMSMNKSETNNCTEKSYNLRSSVASRQTVESKQYSTNNQRQFAENKPRLTCKSLSNLLDPGHSIIPSSGCSISYAQNLSAGFLKKANETKRNSKECKTNNYNVEGELQFLSNGTVTSFPRTCSNADISTEPTSNNTKQHVKAFGINNSTNDAPGPPADNNIPLWHPLFGSNTKPAYNSPWQWTTVTATGE